MRSGFNTEDRLIGYLQRQQFDLYHDQTLDHEYKIDFVIRRFPGSPKFHSLGVQVTTNIGAIQKMNEFAQVHSSDYRVVDKVVYLELDPLLDFEKGVGPLVAIALSEFQFNTKHQGDKMAGIKINADMTYSIFDIAAMLGSLAKIEFETREKSSTEALANISPPKASTPMPIPADLSAVSAMQKALRGEMQGEATSPRSTEKVCGFINAYYKTKDYGFIMAQSGETYFFGLTAISDGELRDRILALPNVEWGSTLEGTVEFQNGGKTRPNARYPEAKGVRIAK